MGGAEGQQSGQKGVGLGVLFWSCLHSTLCKSEKTLTVHIKEREVVMGRRGWNMVGMGILGSLSKHSLVLLLT